LTSAAISISFAARQAFVSGVIKMQDFLPFHRMEERIGLEKQDSDVATFYAFLYYGELITKFLTAGLVSALSDDKDRHRYRIAYRLVRADGIGEWAATLDEILTGPASQLLTPQSRQEQKDLTQRVATGSWQYDAVAALRKCGSILGAQVDPIGNAAAARQWFSIFAALRNKTRGHGAPTANICTQVCQPLEESLRLLTSNFRLFRRPWAFLHRNLSGKYRVTPISPILTEFDSLKRETGASLPDGVYVLYDTPTLVDLVSSDVDASDFLLPNGDYRAGTYELLSYVTGQTARVDGKRYTDPIQPLPTSETHPSKELDILGKSFSNLPPKPQGYVPRESLEHELAEQLQIERHPIVTLTGSGGIGKTSLALSVLHQLVTSNDNRFEMILWFSARDIDLLEEGPKPVRPHTISLSDFAEEYSVLVSGGQENRKRTEALNEFGNALSKTPIGPTLFVFDNFETIVSPADVFRWIDTYVRPPNKILITTRIRDFAGDYPIEVPGMAEQEAYQLIDKFSRYLGIQNLINQEYVAAVYQESDGHPYVIKILLGEVAKRGMLSKPERIVADREEILTALFERTYATLSPAAQRIYLLLSSWRSVLPELAVEAVVLRPGNDRIDVKRAIEELKRTSLIEEIPSTKDAELFISVPLAAATFGKRKLTASPMKAAVEADAQLLRDFGAARKEGIRHGIMPRIRQLLATTAQRALTNNTIIEDSRPTLEFIARRVPSVWLDLAQLYREQGSPAAMEQAKEYIRRYLEKPANQEGPSDVWKGLAEICAATNDYAGEVHALVAMCETPEIPLEVVSWSANRINSINFQLKARGLSIFDTQERKVLIQRIASAMENHVTDFDATDCSRLGWLYAHLGNEKRARSMAEKGLTLNPSNEYCQRLLAKLS
jgi:tetratricopeptide (TPR) repeat protein